MGIVLENWILRRGSFRLAIPKLEAAKGIHCLVGASGSGKTSVLLALGGFLPLESGRTMVDGIDLSGKPPELRGLPLVPQEGGLFSHATVAANIAFGLRLQGVLRKDRDHRVEAMLDTVGLSGLGKRYPHEISGGQARRVALARALVVDARWTLLDEPFAHVDAETRERLYETLRHARAKGRNALLVTHDSEDVQELADGVTPLQ